MPTITDPSRVVEAVAQPEAAPRPVTVEQLEEISRDRTHRHELLRGELITMSPTGGQHGRFVYQLTIVLGQYISEHDLGAGFGAETGFRLQVDPAIVLAPDVSFIRKENFTPERDAVSFVPGAPDLVVEVLSPSDGATYVQKKVETWLHHGAQLVWVVEPETQTVHVYRTDGSVNLLKVGDALNGEKVLPGFSYPLARLFGVETATR